MATKQAAVRQADRKMNVTGTAGREPTAEAAYTREELLAGSEALFAVKPEVVTGALFGSAKERFTVEETSRMIRQFNQRKVLR